MGVDTSKLIRLYLNKMEKKNTGKKEKAIVILPFLNNRKVIKGHKLGWLVGREPSLSSEGFLWEGCLSWPRRPDSYLARWMCRHGCLRQRPGLTGDRGPEPGDTTLREEQEGGWGVRRPRSQVTVHVHT